ncbi:MAG: hypothetical protein V4582_09370 [Pseudomonadota bacterium]
MPLSSSKKDGSDRSRGGKPARGALPVGASAPLPQTGIRGRGKEKAVSKPNAVKSAARSLGTPMPSQTPALRAGTLLLSKIERLAHVGDDFVLIELKRARGPSDDQFFTAKALVKHASALIPADEIEQILERFATTVAGKASTLPVNRKFIASLAEQATAARAQHVKAGTLLPVSAMVNRLGISKQAVSKALKEHRWFCVDGPAGTHLYPAFFADGKYDRRELEKVSKALGELPGPSKWQFFTTPKVSLNGRTPLVALANGDVKPVLVAAAGFAER